MECDRCGRRISRREVRWPADLVEQVLCGICSGLGYPSVLVCSGFQIEEDEEEE